MTTPQYPPAWQPPTGPPQPQYPPPPQPGGATPGGYPPASYPPPQYPGGTTPGGYPPSAYPPSSGPAAYPGGYQQPGQTYPPAQPGYQPEPPTNVMGGPPSYPPTGPDLSGMGPVEPPKKSFAGKIVGVLAGLVVIALVAGLKFGLGTVIQNVLGSGGSSTPAPSNPFEGTAAENYGSGEAAIEVPAATAVDGFTEDEVAAALETVRQALIAGRLDERMLYDHDRTTLRALFSPFGAEDLDLMFEEKLGGIVATMIAPGYTLTDDPIRVSGTMTFAGTVVEGIRHLEVHTQYVWVYPFTGELKEPGDHLVTLKDDLYWMFPVPSEVDAEFVGMYLDVRSSSFAYNIDCDLLDQDLVALGKPQYTFGGGEEIDPNDVMDPNSTVDLPDTC